MALESFYGGKPGISPVIKASFKFINTEDPAYQAAFINNGRDAAALKEYTMDECFKNIDYTDVWYGELCIIDTENKMNPNNGKLYRRTLKRSENGSLNSGNTTYAEYIGQIVGPSGGVPNLDLGSLNTEREKAVGIKQTYDTDGNLPLDTSEWDYSYRDAESGQMTNANPQGDISKIKVLDAGGINGQNIEMVPGKVGNTYNDTIKYTWCNVRRTLDNSEQDAWIYLGFQIPYTIFDITAQHVNYTYNGDNIVVENKPDGLDHPFYKNYDFKIPRGTRGIGPEEIFIVRNPGDKPAELYKFDGAIAYDSDTDVYSISSTAKHPTEEELDGSYWVGKWVLYNPKTGNTTPTPVWLYLGSYKDINNIEIDNRTGDLLIKYSDNSSMSAGNLHLIKSVNYDDATGKITFNYTDNNPNTNNLLSITANGNIQYINNFEIKSDGHLYGKYNVNTVSEEKDFGLVRGNVTTGPVYTLTPSEPSTSAYYTSSDNALLDLQEKEFDGHNPTSIGGNGNGRIVVNGTDVTGGLVAAQIKTEENSPVSTVLFYYNTQTQTWNEVGTIGNGNISGSNSNVYIVGPKDDYNNNDEGKSVSDPDENIIYPNRNDISPEIYFIDDRIISTHINDDLETIVGPDQSVSLDVLGILPYDYKGE